MLDTIVDDELGQVVMTKLKIKTEWTIPTANRIEDIRKEKDTCTSIYNGSDTRAGIRDGFKFHPNSETRLFQRVYLNSHPGVMLRQTASAAAC